LELEDISSGMPACDGVRIYGKGRALTL